MSEIVIHRDHGMTLRKAKVAAEQVCAELGEEFDIDYVWHGNRLEFARSGVTGTITVDKKHVEVRAKLGFVLMFLRGRIESEIHRFFDENFGPET